MIEVTRPSGGRGSVLAAVAFVAALVACLAFTTQAFAAANSVATTSTTKITLAKGFTKKLKKSGVKIKAVAPATVKGNVVTLPVAEGSIDPTNGQGTLTHSGGIKFKKGSKSAIVKNLVLETATSSVKANVAGKSMKFASLSGLSNVRNGFGTNISASSMKLTGSAASQLNKKVAPPAKKKKKKKNKRATLSKKKAKKAAKPFKGNLVLGSSTSEVQPTKVTVLPGGSATFATNATTFGKLENVEVVVTPTGGSTETAKNPAVYTFPIVGGLISPQLTSGLVETSGGFKLTQILPTGPNPGEAIQTEITLASVSVDMAQKTLIAETIAVSNAETSPGVKPLDLGNLGRSSFADVNIPAGQLSIDPISRTVSLQNAPATLQAVSGQVLNGFVQVYAGYVKGGAELMGASEEEGKAIAAGIEAENGIKEGDPLGVFSFSAVTQ